MIIAEICIYMIFSSKQLKMEDHKAKPFFLKFHKKPGICEKEFGKLESPVSSLFSVSFRPFISEIKL